MSKSIQKPVSRLTFEKFQRQLPGMMNQITHYIIKLKPQRLDTAFSALRRKQELLENIIKRKRKDCYIPPCSIGSKALGDHVTASKFFFQKQVDFF